MSKTNNLYKLYDFIFPGRKVTILVTLTNINCNKIQ
jgi:hypothetical protein